MALTYSQIQSRITKLQAEAAALRRKEVAGVVAKIRQAIEHYGLTAEDLGLNGPASKSAKSGKKAVGAKRSVGVIKYRDDTGRTWTGHGKRPGWFVAALASGKSAEDLRV